MNEPVPGWRAAAAVVASLLLCAGAALAQGRAALRNGDYIVAIINSEAVTAGEIDRRVQREQLEARRDGQRAPDEPELRRQVLDSLINERVLITYARDAGVKIDDGDLDRAVQGVAVQNQLTVTQLRARLQQEGIDYARFRANLRDQMMVERVREREVYQRIRVTDAEIDRLVAQRRAAAQADAEVNVAQILVAVPEGAPEAVRAERKARAESALARVRRGEDFGAVARELSDDANRARGGEIGMRPASRLPDVFVEALRGVPVGGTTPELLVTGAGYHVLKILDRREGAAVRTSQTRARHILLRTSAQLSAEVASQRLSEMRRQIESGQRKFEDLARQSSDDVTAPAGGDLGWIGPGVFVPEFEEAMNGLPINGLSEPVVSRFGVHLIQVLERREVSVEEKQLREQARNVLREQKFEQAYLDWARDLRLRAYVEMRDPPL
jgi:peptidyl-prolyl cis-trans isomerase SurA